MKSRLMLTVAATVVVAAGLGVTAVHGLDRSPRPTSTTTAHPTYATPTPGATIGADQVTAAAAHGLSAFAVGPGSLVVVDPHHPLPGSVVSAVKAELGDLRTPAKDKASLAALTARVSGVLDHLNQTGLYGVLIVPGFTYDASWAATPVVQVVTFSPGFAHPGDATLTFTDPARARAAVQAVLAKQPDPTRYAVIDATT